jgi:hypothetical protein
MLMCAEYGYTMKITEKVDVYGYGVVLLELLTGKDSIDHSSPDGMDLVNWVIVTLTESQSMELVLDDQLLRSGSDNDRRQMLLVLRIALFCVSKNPAVRPTMREVVEMLEQAKVPCPKTGEKRDAFTQDNMGSIINCLLRLEPKPTVQIADR